MIETLINLKNNRSKRNIAQNQGGAAVERMKRFLSGLSKTRHGMLLIIYVFPHFKQQLFLVRAHEPLRVSLEDLRSADSKGKWWLVGAGWGGDPLVDKQAELSKKMAACETDAIQDEAAKLAKVARAQGMNTEIRRGIFIVLMSSDVSPISVLSISVAHFRAVLGLY